MPSFLTARRFVSLSIVVNAPVEKVLKILHNPHAFLRLSPLVLSISTDHPGSSSFIVTERLGFLGYFHATTSFHCTLTNGDDKVETKVDAGGGTKIRGVFQVKSGGLNGTSVVTENATVEGLFFLMPYIVHTMTQAHLGTLSTLANKVEKTANRSPQEVEMTISGSPISSLFIVLVALICVLIFWTGNRYTSILIISGALWILYRQSMGSSSDPYGLFHLALNCLPGQDPTKPPQTEWLNMGFWKDTDIFPQACRALALKLIQATGCKRGDRVLDVGYGTGESLLLLLSDSLIRPSFLTGITSLPHHHHRAQNRVRQFQKSLGEPETEVSLHAYDAIYHPTNVGHPLDPATAQVFDVILALDCAYHFNTRKMFLHQSFEKLAPGGRIGLADICFDPSTGSRAWLVSSLIRVIPKYNLVSIRDYISDMKEVGYVDIELDDITEDVFPGFIHFLKSRGWGWATFGTLLQWYVNSGARFVIVCGSKAL